MFQHVIDRIYEKLNGYLSEWIEPIQRFQISWSVLCKDNLKLSHLQLRQKVLDFLPVKVDLIFSYIKGIQVHVPLCALLVRPIRVEIDTVILAVETTPAWRWDPLVYRENYEKLKKVQLDAEQMSSMINAFEGGLLWSFVIRLARNVQVEIHHVHLRLEDHLGKTPLALGVDIRSISVESTNDPITKTLQASAESRVGLIFKKATIQQASVYVDELLSPSFDQNLLQPFKDYGMMSTRRYHRHYMRYTAETSTHEVQSMPSMDEEAAEEAHCYFPFCSPQRRLKSNELKVNEQATAAKKGSQEYAKQKFHLKTRRFAFDGRVGWRRLLAPFCKRDVYDLDENKWIDDPEDVDSSSLQNNDAGKHASYSKLSGFFTRFQKLSSTMSLSDVNAYEDEARFWTKNPVIVVEPQADDDDRLSHVTSYAEPQYRQLKRHYSYVAQPSMRCKPELLKAFSILVLDQLLNCYHCHCLHEFGCQAIISFCAIPTFANSVPSSADYSWADADEDPLPNMSRNPHVPVPQTKVDITLSDAELNVTDKQLLLALGVMTTTFAHYSQWTNGVRAQFETASESLQMSQFYVQHWPDKLFKRSTMSPEILEELTLFEQTTAPHIISRLRHQCLDEVLHWKQFRDDDHSLPEGQRGAFSPCCWSPTSPTPQPPYEDKNALERELSFTYSGAYAIIQTMKDLLEGNEDLLEHARSLRSVRFQTTVAVDVVLLNANLTLNFTEPDTTSNPLDFRSCQLYATLLCCHVHFRINPRRESIFLHADMFPLCVYYCLPSHQLKDEVIVAPLVHFSSPRNPDRDALLRKLYPLAWTESAPSALIQQLRGLQPELTMTLVMQNFRNPKLPDLAANVIIEGQFLAFLIPSQLLEVYTWVNNLLTGLQAQNKSSQLLIESLPKVKSLLCAGAAYSAAIFQGNNPFASFYIKCEILDSASVYILKSSRSFLCQAYTMTFDSLTVSTARERDPDGVTGQTFTDRYTLRIHNARIGRIVDLLSHLRTHALYLGMYTFGFSYGFLNSLSHRAKFFHQHVLLYEREMRHKADQSPPSNVKAQSISFETSFSSWDEDALPPVNQSCVVYPVPELQLHLALLSVERLCHLKADFHHDLRLDICDYDVVFLSEVLDAVNKSSQFPLIVSSSPRLVSSPNAPSALSPLEDEGSSQKPQRPSPAAKTRVRFQGSPERKQSCPSPDSLGTEMYSDAVATDMSLLYPTKQDNFLETQSAESLTSEVKSTGPAPLPEFSLLLKLHIRHVYFCVLAPVDPTTTRAALPAFGSFQLISPLMGIIWKDIDLQAMKSVPDNLMEMSCKIGSLVIREESNISPIIFSELYMPAPFSRPEIHFSMVTCLEFEDLLRSRFSTLEQPVLSNANFSSKSEVPDTLPHMSVCVSINSQSGQHAVMVWNQGLRICCLWEALDELMVWALTQLKTFQNVQASSPSFTAPPSELVEPETTVASLPFNVPIRSVDIAFKLECVEILLPAGPIRSPLVSSFFTDRDFQDPDHLTPVQQFQQKLASVTASLKQCGMQLPQCMCVSATVDLKTHLLSLKPAPSKLPHVVESSISSPHQPPPSSLLASTYVTANSASPDLASPLSQVISDLKASTLYSPNFSDQSPNLGPLKNSPTFTSSSPALHETVSAVSSMETLASLTAPSPLVESEPKLFACYMAILKLICPSNIKIGLTITEFTVSSVQPRLQSVIDRPVITRAAGQGISKKILSPMRVTTMVNLWLPSPEAVLERCYGVSPYTSLILRKARGIAEQAYFEGIDLSVSVEPLNVFVEPDLAITFLQCLTISGSFLAYAAYKFSALNAVEWDQSSDIFAPDVASVYPATSSLLDESEYSGGQSGTFSLVSNLCRTMTFNVDISVETVRIRCHSMRQTMRQDAITLFFDDFQFLFRISPDLPPKIDPDQFWWNAYNPLSDVASCSFFDKDYIVPFNYDAVSNPYKRRRQQAKMAISTVWNHIGALCKRSKKYAPNGPNPKSKVAHNPTMLDQLSPSTETKRTVVMRHPMSSPWMEAHCVLRTQLDYYSYSEKKEYSAIEPVEVAALYAKESTESNAVIKARVSWINLNLSLSAFTVFLEFASQVVTAWREKESNLHLDDLRSFFRREKRSCVTPWLKQDPSYVQPIPRYSNFASDAECPILESKSFMLKSKVSNFTNLDSDGDDLLRSQFQSQALSRQLTGPKLSACVPNDSIFSDIFDVVTVEGKCFFLRPPQRFCAYVCLMKVLDSSVFPEILLKASQSASNESKLADDIFRSLVNKPQMSLEEPKNPQAKQNAFTAVAQAAIAERHKITLHKSKLYNLLGQPISVVQYLNDRKTRTTTNESTTKLVLPNQAHVLETDHKGQVEPFLIRLQCLNFVYEIPSLLFNFNVDNIQTIYLSLKDPPQTTKSGFLAPLARSYSIFAPRNMFEMGSDRRVSNYKSRVKQIRPTPKCLPNHPPQHRRKRSLATDTYKSLSSHPRPSSSKASASTTAVWNPHEAKRPAESVAMIVRIANLTTQMGQSYAEIYLSSNIVVCNNTPTDLIVFPTIPSVTQASVSLKELGEPDLPPNLAKEAELIAQDICYGIQPRVVTSGIESEFYKRQKSFRSRWKNAFKSAVNAQTRLPRRSPRQPFASASGATSLSINLFPMKVFTPSEVIRHVIKAGMLAESLGLKNGTVAPGGDPSTKVGPVNTPGLSVTSPTPYSILKRRASVKNNFLWLSHTDTTSTQFLPLYWLTGANNGLWLSQLSEKTDVIPSMGEMYQLLTSSRADLLVQRQVYLECLSQELNFIPNAQLPNIFLPKSLRIAREDKEVLHLSASFVIARHQQLSRSTTMLEIHIDPSFEICNRLPCPLTMISKPPLSLTMGTAKLNSKPAKETVPTSNLRHPIFDSAEFNSIQPKTDDLIRLDIGEDLKLVVVKTAYVMELGCFATKPLALSDLKVADPQNRNTVAQLVFYRQTYDQHQQQENSQSSNELVQRDISLEMNRLETKRLTRFASQPGLEAIIIRYTVSAGLAKPTKRHPSKAKLYMMPTLIRAITLYSDAWIENRLEYPISLCRSDYDRQIYVLPHCRHLIPSDFKGFKVLLAVNSEDLEDESLFERYPMRSKGWFFGSPQTLAHSDEFEIGDLGKHYANIRCTQFCPHLEFAVSMGTAPQPFLRTIVVQVLPRFVLINDRHIALWVRECTLDSSKRDAELNLRASVYLAPGASLEYHCQYRKHPLDSVMIQISGLPIVEDHFRKEIKPSLKQVAGLAPKSQHDLSMWWSSPIDITHPQIVQIRHPSVPSLFHQTCSFSITETEVRNQSGVAFIRFQEPSVPNYAIVNLSSSSVAVGQSDQDFFEVIRPIGSPYKDMLGTLVPSTTKKRGRAKSGGEDVTAQTTQRLLDTMATPFTWYDPSLVRKKLLLWCVEDTHSPDLDYDHLDRKKGGMTNSVAVEIPGQSSTRLTDMEENVAGLELDPSHPPGGKGGMRLNETKMLVSEAQLMIWGAARSAPDWQTYIASVELEAMFEALKTQRKDGYFKRFKNPMPLALAPWKGGNVEPQNPQTVPEKASTKAMKPDAGSERSQTFLKIRFGITSGVRILFILDDAPRSAKSHAMTTSSSSEDSALHGPQDAKKWSPIDSVMMQTVLKLWIEGQTDPSQLEELFVVVRNLDSALAQLKQVWQHGSASARQTLLNLFETRAPSHHGYLALIEAGANCSSTPAKLLKAQTTSQSVKGLPQGTSALTEVLHDPDGGLDAAMKAYVSQAGLVQMSAVSSDQFFPAASSNDINFDCSLSMHGIGISFVDHVPSEFLYCSVSCIHTKALLSPGNWIALDCQLGWVQMDNLSPGAKYPTSLCPITSVVAAAARGSTDSSWAKTNDKAYVARFEAQYKFPIARSVQQHLLEVPLLNVYLSPLAVNIDASMIIALLTFLDNLLVLLNIEILDDTVLKMRKADADPGCPEWNNQLGPAIQIFDRSTVLTRVFLTTIMIEKLIFVVNIHLSKRLTASEQATEDPDDAPSEPKTDAIRLIVAALALRASISDANLELAAVHKKNLCGPVNHLVAEIANSYLGPAKLQLHKVLGAIDLLGNPALVIKHVSSGFQNAVRELDRGIAARNPRKTALSVARGAKFIAGGIAAGAFELMTRCFGSWREIVEACARNSDAYSLDSRALYSSGARERQTSSIAGFRNNCLLCATDFGISAMNIFYKPYKGCRLGIAKAKQQKQCGAKVLQCGQLTTAGTLSGLSSSCGFVSSFCHFGQFTSATVLNQILALPMQSFIRPKRAFNVFYGAMMTADKSYHYGYAYSQQILTTMIPQVQKTYKFAAAILLKLEDKSKLTRLERLNRYLRRSEVQEYQYNDFLLLSSDYLALHERQMICWIHPARNLVSMRVVQFVRTCSTASGYRKSSQSCKPAIQRSSQRHLKKVTIAPNPHQQRWLPMTSTRLTSESKPGVHIAHGDIAIQLVFKGTSEAHRLHFGTIQQKKWCVTPSRPVTPPRTVSKIFSSTDDVFPQSTRFDGVRNDCVSATGVDDTSFHRQSSNASSDKALEASMMSITSSKLDVPSGSQVPHLQTEYVQCPSKVFALNLFSHMCEVYQQALLANSAAANKQG